VLNDGVDMWQWPRGALLFREHLFYASIQLAADWRALAASHRFLVPSQQDLASRAIKFHWSNFRVSFRLWGQPHALRAKNAETFGAPIMANDSCCSW
jgi:hypothetical protein